MPEELIKYFEKHIVLEEEEIDFLSHNIPVKEIPKNTLLLAEGEISKKFYFILFC